MRNIRFSRVAGIGAIFILSAATAYAYVPPSQFIVKTIARKHSGYKRIVAKTLVTNWESGQPGSVRFREVTAYFPATGTLRSWATDENGKSLYETERKAREMSPSAEILFEPNTARLTDSLKAKGIAIQTEAELLPLPNEDERRLAEKTGLARWDKGIVWVVGLKNPQSEISRRSFSTPQIWVEKDTFLPLRLIAAIQTDDSDISDLQLEGYRYFNEFPYPKLITWMKGKEPAFRAELTEINVDSGPDLSKKAVAGGWTDAGNAASGAVRDLIRAYYSVLR